MGYITDIIIFLIPFVLILCTITSMITILQVKENHSQVVQSSRFNKNTRVTPQVKVEKPTMGNNC